MHNAQNRVRKFFIEILFNNIGGGVAGKTYELKLMAFDTEEKALGVYGYEAKNNQAIINGQKSEYNVSIGIHSYTDLYKKITIATINS